MLAEDLDTIVERAKKHWTFATREEVPEVWQIVDDDTSHRIV